MSFLLGLTGSIGMGKSTAAQMFAAAGCPVWDADAVVHDLYGSGGAGAEAIATIVPAAVSESGVSRDILRSAIKEDASLLPRIEQVVHPLVSASRQQFIAESTAPILVFEIPLLFETGAQEALDAVAVVSTDATRQRERVLSRLGMSDDTLSMILGKQVPDEEKRALADYIIDSTTIETAQRDVARILAQIETRIQNA